jgi:asparagine synthase (glutamine-hydrolysing)
MCGISLIIQTKQEQPEESLIHAMNQKVVHRGPDDEGVFIHNNVALGHRRLSIIDVSVKGHQPMQKDGVWITYNGEVYNYLELRTELEALGYSFDSACDTEIILAAWLEWGVKSFERMNGMWAIIIYDLKAGKVILSRDHFGIKPLFYTSSGSYFLAGSEIKQFTAIPSFQPNLNHKVAYNFFLSGLLNYSEESFFDGVLAVKPGHYLEYDLSSNRYTDYEWYSLPGRIKPVQDNFETAKLKIAELIKDSLRIRVRSDVRLGSCLSGGIDSSGIVTTLYTNKYVNGSFATITSCFEDKAFDERFYSDIVTAKTRHLGISVFPDLDELITLDHLDLMLYHQEQPISTASHYSEFKVFETAARNGFKVMLDGQGADEYFWGYDEFFTTKVEYLIKKGRIFRALDLLRHKAAHNESSLLEELKVAFNTFYFFPLIKYSKNAVGIPEIPWIEKVWQKQLSAGEFESETADCNALSMEQMKFSSLPYQLHSEDRNSMLFSVESRLPFLDPRLVEYVMGLPASFKISDGYSKFILREALEDLPEEIRYRKHKMGFPAPDQTWVKNNPSMIRQKLSEAIDEIPFFNENLLSRYEQFLKGEIGYEPIYLRAISFHRFIKIFKLII